VDCWVTEPLDQFHRTSPLPTASDATDIILHSVNYPEGRPFHEFRVLTRVVFPPNLNFYSHDIDNFLTSIRSSANLKYEYICPAFAYSPEYGKVLSMTDRIQKPGKPYIVWLHRISDDVIAQAAGTLWEIASEANLIEVEDPGEISKILLILPWHDGPVHTLSQSRYVSADHFGRNIGPLPRRDPEVGEIINLDSADNDLSMNNAIAGCSSSTNYGATQNQSDMDKYLGNDVSLSNHLAKPHPLDMNILVGQEEPIYSLVNNQKIEFDVRKDTTLTEPCLGIGSEQNTPKGLINSISTHHNENNFQATTIGDGNDDEPMQSLLDPQSFIPIKKDEVINNSHCHSQIENCSRSCEAREDILNRAKFEEACRHRMAMLNVEEIQFGGLGTCSPASTIHTDLLSRSPSSQNTASEDDDYEGPLYSLVN